ncbi:MAG: hypothetical protein LIP16_15205 [Clostridium sp.]|nr:hypothetical protein [Clostridium sp.]
MDKPDAAIEKFDNFLVARNDVLDNAAYNLALEMLQLKEQPDSETKFPWNMEIIGALLESTQSILEEHGHAVCWPYYEEEMPCCQTGSCAKTDCLLKGRPKGG